MDYKPKVATIENVFLKLLDYDLWIITEVEDDYLLNQISRIAEAHKIKLVIGNVNGVFSRVFNQFGEFTVLDKNGEEPGEIMVKWIEKDIIELIPG